MKTAFIVLALAIARCSATNDGQLDTRKPVFLLQPFIAQPPQVKLSPESVEEVTKAVMERLRSEEGAQSGNYYVYLPDGKLQKVEFTTAPLKEEEKKEEKAALVVEPPQFFFFQGKEAAYLRGEVETSGRVVQEDAPRAKGFVASVQYTDVEPLNAPVYAQNNAPLTRVLRYAPQFY